MEIEIQPTCVSSNVASPCVKSVCNDVASSPIKPRSSKRGWSSDIYQYGSAVCGDDEPIRSDDGRNVKRLHNHAQSAPAMLGRPTAETRTTSECGVSNVRGGDVSDRPSRNGLHADRDPAIGIAHARVHAPIAAAAAAISVATSDTSSPRGDTATCLSQDATKEERVKKAFERTGFTLNRAIIASGKFGTVYAFGPDHVVKSVKYDKNEPSFTMREVRILHALQGTPGVIKAFGFNRHEEGITLLLERYETTMFHSIPVLSDIQMLEFGAQLCSAVAAIHAKGVMHRDLHTGNILIRGNHLCLTDFGNSKFVRGYRHSAIVTTLPNIAPEQITCPITGRFENKFTVYDHRCDLWALGCILHEMYTGDYKFPFTVDKFDVFHETLGKFRDFNIRPDTDHALIYASSLLLRKVPRQRVPAERVALLLREAYQVDLAKLNDSALHRRCDGRVVL